MNKKFAAFFGAFFSTVILCTTLCGLAAVDMKADESGYGCFGDIVGIEKLDKNFATVKSFKGSRTLPIKNLNQYINLRHQNDNLYHSQYFRLMYRWSFAINSQVRQIQSQRKELDYKKNAGLI